PPQVAELSAKTTLFAESSAGPGRSPDPAHRKSLADQLDRDGHRLAPADAERGDSPPPAPAAQGMEEGRQNARAGGADRMAEGACAPIYIDARVVDVEVPHCGHGDGRERFIDLIEIGIVRLPPEPG